ncbi:hypothetical protein Q31b_50930 [Novipirellula aureliae]|uniref:Uncharacterized protein n=1 Tax=Novipirellula aureliae TaxID=2527966 RepID=A0A5C6DG12_9BACT|nr:hypothetical protein [Novipirellula aureliae]TWU35658.1 hypothetical protein Q31b_50930 [Novipirellula aureliae]
MEDHYVAPPADRSTEVNAQTHLSSAQVGAIRVKEGAGGAYLYAIGRDMFGAAADAHSFVAMRNQLLADAGHPEDPMAVMMVEQAAMAHHRVGRLYVLAATADVPEKIETYQRMIVALLGEFRRLCLAIKKYREPTPAKQVTVVGQQNLATNQQIAYVEGSEGTEKKNHDTEVGSKHQKGIGYAEDNSAFNQSAPSRSREAQPVAAR